MAGFVGVGFIDLLRNSIKIYGSMDPIQAIPTGRTGVRASSRLTEVAVRPKPIERQKVATCLRVFCDETCAALRTNPETKDADGTCRFIQKMVD